MEPQTFMKTDSEKMLKESLTLRRWKIFDHTKHGDTKEHHRGKQMGLRNNPTEIAIKSSDGRANIWQGNGKTTFGQHHNSRKQSSLPSTFLTILSPNAILANVNELKTKFDKSVLQFSIP